MRSKNIAQEGTENNMESLNDIKKRIKSVQSTRQVTKAMEVVSATKMRKSQESALKARGYAFAAFELLANLDKYEASIKKPALFVRPKAPKTLLVVVASDKGLAGSLNSNVLKKALAWYTKEHGITNGTVDLVVAGKKASAFFKFRNIAIKKHFFGHGDFADFNEVQDMTEFIKLEFLSGAYGRVMIIYTNFRSTLKQEAVVREILPLKEKGLQEMIEGLTPEKGRHSEATSYKLPAKSSTDYLFEPSPEKVFTELTTRLFQMMVYHIILESNASEHSARMVAMKTASENAAEIVEDLTLIYNKGRQAKITQELVEITSATDAISS